MSAKSRLAAFLVAMASVALLQIHGIEFWTAQAGPTGIIWSLVLEIAAIYLWLHRVTLPALLASCLLIAGPLYQVSSPILEEGRKAEVVAMTKVETEREIAQLEASLQQYEKNSTSRIGWSGRIDRTQEQLATARDRLRGLLRLQERGRGWKKFSIISLEALALLVVLYSQIFALSRIREDSKIQAKDRRKDGGGDFTVNPEAEGFSGDSKITGTLVNDTKDRVKMARNLVEDKLPDFDGKRQLLAQHVGVRLADLSLLRHHEKRSREGRETISRKKLEKIINHLGGGVEISSSI